MSFDWALMEAGMEVEGAGFWRFKKGRTKQKGKRALICSL